MTNFDINNLVYFWRLGGLKYTLAADSDPDETSTIQKRTQTLFTEACERVAHKTGSEWNVVIFATSGIGAVCTREDVTSPQFSSLVNRNTFMAAVLVPRAGIEKMTLVNSLADLLPN